MGNSLTNDLLRIAIDMRPAQRPDTGIGRYAHNLAANLSHLKTVKPHLMYKAKPPRQLFDIPTDISSNNNWINCHVPYYCIEHNIHIFHGTNYVLPLFTRVKRVVSFHDTSVFRPASKMWNLERAQLALHALVSLIVADAVIVHTNEVAAKLKAYVPKIARRLHKVPLAAEEQFRPCANRHHLTENNPCLSPLYGSSYFLIVAKHEYRKHISTIIDAFSRFSAVSGSIWKLVIVGPEGPATQSIASARQASNVRSNIHILGTIEDLHLVRLYQHATGLICFSSNEGYGLPVIEAMSCGTAVIISNQDSLLEVGGRAVWVVPTLTSEALAVTMKTVATAGDERSKRIQIGLALAGARSWRQVASATTDVYFSI